MRLIGRTTELETLLARIHDRGSALVRGAAGVGKTSLVRLVAERLAADDWVVETTVVAASSQAVPLGPFLYLYGDRIAPHQPAEHPLWLADELRARAADRRLVVVVDDSHLMDPASIQFVTRLIGEERIPVLLAARTIEGSADTPPIPTTDGHMMTIELNALDRAECEQLVTAILRPTVEPSVHDEIWRLSEGNPLYVRELLDAGRANGVLKRRGDQCWTLTGRFGSTPALRTLVGERLERLSSSARCFLEALGDAGPLQTTAVVRLIPQPELDQLQQDGLVRIEHLHGREIVAAGHPLYGEVSCDIASAARLRMARRRLADALSAAGLRDPDAIALRARLELDLGGREADLFISAGTTALQGSHAQFALRCADAALAADAGFPAEVLRAGALGALGRRAEADALFASLAHETTDPAVRVSLVVQNVVAHLGYGEGDIARATELLRAEIAVLPERAAAPLRSMLTVTTFFGGRPEDAVRDAQPLLTDPTVPIIRGVGLGYVAAQSVLGRPDLALPLLDRGFEELRTMDMDPFEWLVGLVASMWVRLFSLWQMGRSLEGDDPVSQMHGIDHPLIEGQPMAWIFAAQHWIRGHFDAALVERAKLDDYLAVSPFQVRTFTATLFAALHALQGNVPEARRNLALIDATPPAPVAGFRWWTERARAFTFVAEGDVGAGVEHSLTLAERHQAECFHATTSLYDVVRFGRADLVADRLAHQTTREGATWWDSVCADHGAAAARHDAAALLDVARRLEAGGLDHYACEAAAHAATAAREHGVRGDEEHARARVQELRTRCGRLRTPAVIASNLLLSRRELEVTMLAVSGFSNPEIAERLGTSPRTVGNQLQAVYHKLHIHSRAELRARLDGGDPAP